MNAPMRRSIVTAVIAAAASLAAVLTDAQAAVDAPTAAATSPPIR